MDEISSTTPPPKSEKKASSPYSIIEKDDYEKAVELLVSLGWKKTESKKKVDDCIKSWMDDTGDKPIETDNFEEFAKRLMFGRN